MPRWLLSNSKVVNVCEDKRRGKIVPVLKWYLEKFDIKSSRLVLSVPAWCENEAYLVTGMESNLRLVVVEIAGVV